MSKVDWSKSPEGAQYYANKAYWKCNGMTCGYLVLVDNIWIDAGTTITFAHSPFFYDDVQSKANHIVDANKKVWPSESRIDIIGTNGNTGEGYVHYALNNTKTVKADEILSEGLQILTQRGEQYGSEGRECSFPEAATAFNALTGHNIKGSDVCLILALVKQVRQHAQPRYHHDSAVDAVNYLALQAELLASERKS